MGGGPGGLDGRERLRPLVGDFPIPLHPPRVRLRPPPGACYLPNQRVKIPKILGRSSGRALSTTTRPKVSSQPMATIATRGLTVMARPTLQERLPPFLAARRLSGMSEAWPIVGPIWPHLREGRDVLRARTEEGQQAQDQEGDRE